MPATSPRSYAIELVLNTGANAITNEANATLEAKSRGGVGDR